MQRYVQSYIRYGSNITKLYISNFLTGLVLWYGIEKLFMTSIGIDAWGVAIATAVYLVFSLVLDIPSGIVADRWSRKGVLIVAGASLAVSSLIFGASNNVYMYAIGEVFYALYFVAVSGTYQALTYDLLHEQGKTHAYSKVEGAAHALFFAGAAITSALGGFVAAATNYRMTFFLTAIPCAINIAVLFTIREPQFHKAEQKEKAILQLRRVLSVLLRVGSVHVLALTLSALAAVEVFKSEFGQLYLQRFFSDAEALGILWAIYSLTWAIGSLVAHKFHAKIGWLLAATVAPYVVMSLFDSLASVPLFMLQAAAMAAFTNQVETNLQNAAPSSVRTSLLSVLSSMGRVISVPASFGIGWVILHSNALWGLRAVTLVASGVALYWVIRRSRNSNDAILNA